MPQAAALAACPSPQWQRLRPRWRRMFTTTAHACAPFPLAVAPVGSVVRRLPPFRRPQALRPSHCFAAKAAACGGFPAVCWVRKSPKFVPLILIETSAIFFAANGYIAWFLHFANSKLFMKKRSRRSPPPSPKTAAPLVLVSAAAVRLFALRLPRLAHFAARYSAARLAAFFLLHMKHMF